MTDRPRSGAGRFVTLEGVEGVGKTTQAQLLADRLAAHGFEVLATREPGGTALGEAIRELLLDPASHARLESRTDALLFNAARAQLVAEVIGPALARGAVVIATRFSDSTLAYQGYGAGIPLADLRAIEDFATGGLRPDLTVILDMPAEHGLRRKVGPDVTRFESEFDLAFHRRVRDGFLALAAAEPDRFAVIDASADVDAVAANVARIVDDRLAIGRPPTSATPTKPDRVPERIQR